MQGKKPASDYRQHAEVVARLDELKAQMDLLGIEPRKRVN